MTALVIGGAGYIGSHMVRWLTEHGEPCVVLDNLSTGHPEAVNVPLVRCDLRDAGALRDALIQIRPSIVFHFAALALVGESVQQPLAYYENNFLGTLNLVKAMHAADTRRLVFSSTCAVYGVPGSDVIDEAHARNPINPYGASKLACENLLEDFARAGDLSVVALRYFNAAGAHSSGELGESHEPETHLIPNALRAVLGQAKELTVFGQDYPTPDGTCIRDYIHVEDLAQAHGVAMQWLRNHDGWQAINLGTELGTSVIQVLRRVAEIAGRAVPHVLAERRHGDPPKLVASAAKARDILGWIPAHDLDSIVQSAWRWHQAPRY